MTGDHHNHFSTSGPRIPERIGLGVVLEAPARRGQEVKSTAKPWRGERVDGERLEEGGLGDHCRCTFAANFAETRPQSPGFARRTVFSLAPCDQSAMPFSRIAACSFLMSSGVSCGRSIVSVSLMI